MITILLTTLGILFTIGGFALLSFSDADTPWQLQIIFFLMYTGGIALIINQVIKKILHTFVEN